MYYINIYIYIYIYTYIYNLLVLKFYDTVYGCVNKIYIVMWHIYIYIYIYIYICICVYIIMYTFL